MDDGRKGQSRRRFSEKAVGVPEPETEKEPIWVSMMQVNKVPEMLSGSSGRATE